MPRQNLNATRIHILVPNQELEKIIALANRNGLTRSDVLRRAITYFLKAVTNAEKRRRAH